MPLINKWWKLLKIIDLTKSLFKNTFKSTPKNKDHTMEYSVVKLGSVAAKNAEMLNVKATEGWKLVSVVGVAKVGSNGQIINDMQAFLERKIKKPTVIKG